MKLRRRGILLFVVPLLIAALACGLPGGGDEQAAVEAEGGSKETGSETVEGETAEGIVEEAPEAAEAEIEAAPTPESVEGEIAGGSETEYDTVFPLPDDVQNFMGEGGEGQVNFQTSMSLENTIEFYRQEFEAMGLTERTLLTAITDTTFSLVFDGYGNGKALVIQGVDLSGSTNVNIRFEDI